MVIEVYAKVFEQIAKKNCLLKKRYIFIGIGAYKSKIWYDTLKRVSKLCKNFKFVSFELNEKEPVKELHALVEPGQVGPHAAQSYIKMVCRSKKT